MKKHLPTLTAFFLASCYFFINCNKSDQVDSTMPKEKGFSVSDARTWFDNKYKVLSEPTLQRSSFQNVIPQWNKAGTGEDEQFFIVETPFRAGKTTGFKNKAINGSVQSHTKLVILKNKKTEEISSVLMTIVPDSRMPVQTVTYLKRE